MTLRRLRAALARLGARAVLACGMMAVLGWTFVGSLGMGLTTPQHSQPRMVQAWLAGLVAIGGLCSLVAWLAGEPRDG